LTVVGFSAGKILAVDDPLSRLQKAAGLAGLNQTEADPQRIIANIIAIVLGFVGLFFLGSLILAGYRWMTSGGNEDSISKAKARLKNSVIGVTVVIIAYSATLFVNDILFKTTCTDGYYCPPIRPQNTGRCSNDAECQNMFNSDNWGCNTSGSCIDNSCYNVPNDIENIRNLLASIFGPEFILNLDDTSVYCVHNFSSQHRCLDNHCRIP